MTPTKKLQFHTGYLTSRSTGSSEILNERQVQGSLASQYLMPSSDISYQIHPGWFWKAAWNYYGYGEDGSGGPDAGLAISMATCSRSASSMTSRHGKASRR